MLASLVACVAVTAGCEEKAPARTDHLLTSADAAGTQTGSGTDLLRPVAPGCTDIDGDYVWSTATDQDVRAFDRTVDGRTEHTVVGAWPMRKTAALAAIERIGFGSGDCPPPGLAVQNATVSIGDPGSIALEVTKRDPRGKLVSWSVRLYAYTKGHMVIVWSTINPPAPPWPPRPSGKGILDLFHKQEQKLTGAADD